MTVIQLVSINKRLVIKISSPYLSIQPHVNVTKMITARQHVPTQQTSHD